MVALPPPPRASSSPVMLYVNLRTNRTKLVFAAAVYTKLKTRCRVILLLLLQRRKSDTGICNFCTPPITCPPTPPPIPRPPCLLLPRQACKLTMTTHLCTPPIIWPPRPPPPPPRLLALARARPTRSRPNTHVCSIHIHTHVHVYTHARSASSVAFTSVACLSPPCLASHHDNKINCNFQASAIMRPFLLF